MTPGSPEAKAWFAQFVSTYPQVTVKPMFGHNAAFVNGRMAAGTYGDDVVLKLSEADAAEFVNTYHAEGFEPMPGRPMTGFWVVPAAVRGDEAVLRTWLERALDYIESLPPKQK